jgi:hypothetical protein
MPAAESPLEDIVAENLVARLNAATWDGDIVSFTAEIDEVPEWDAAEGELDLFRVAVVPGPSLAFTLKETRGGDKLVVDTGIVMAKALTSKAERKALRSLRNQIIERIRLGTLPAASPAVPDWLRLTSLEIDTAWDKQAQGGPRIFSAQIRIVHTAIIANTG